MLSIVHRIKSVTLERHTLDFIEPEHLQMSKENVFTLNRIIGGSETFDFIYFCRIIRLPNYILIESRGSKNDQILKE